MQAKHDADHVKNASKVTRTADRMFAKAFRGRATPAQWVDWIGKYPAMLATATEWELRALTKAKMIVEYPARELPWRGTAIVLGGSFPPLSCGGIHLNTPSV